MCVGSLYCVFLIARKPRIYATAAFAYHFFKSHQRYVKLAKVIMCMLLHNQTSTKNFSAVLFSNQSIKELNNTKSNYTLKYITLHTAVVESTPFSVSLIFHFQLRIFTVIIPRFSIDSVRITKSTHCT